MLPIVDKSSTQKYVYLTEGEKSMWVKQKTLNNEMKINILSSLL